MITRQMIKVAISFILYLNLMHVSIGKPAEHKTSDKETTDSVNKITDDESEYRVKYAQTMKSFMNESVDPCEDFYEFACGNWKNVIEKRQAQHKRSNLIDIVYKLGDAVEKLMLKSARDLDTDYESEWKLVQQFFNSCLEADLYPMKMSQAYLDIIKSIGGFPAVDETWRADNFSWFNMSAHLSNYGAIGLINEEILPQYPFSPYFKFPDLGFDSIVHSDNIASNTSRAYELNEKRMREYLTTYNVEESRISQIIADIFEFWRAVFKISDQFDEDLDKCQELFAVFDTESFSQWDNYFSIAWMGKDFNVIEDDCPCDFFYKELDKICNNHKEAVANYLAMKFLYHMDARLKDKKFQKEYCVMYLQNALPFVIDKMYLKEHFNAEIQEEVATIIKELRKSLRIILEEADWLDETTRTEALQKESTIISRIGSFKDPEKTERLIREMNHLTFMPDSYEQNNINLKKFKTFMKRYNGLHFEKIQNDTKPLELLIAIQVNSFYYNVDNSINVMAGILHPPAYHKAWSNSLKFGTLGYLIGHEFTHGFDTVGANYDSSGDQRYWWSKKSGKVFDERAECYVNHYNSYLIPEINRKINGNQTKDENIADSGGLREALNAYRRYMKELSKESGELSRVVKDDEMPGLNLSHEQLFFLGFAQLWCADYKEEHYWEELTNAHTMDKYRVLGAVTNNEDFAKAYECPLSSKMNPKEEKCRVW